MPTTTIVDTGPYRQPLAAGGARAVHLRYPLWRHRSWHEGQGHEPLQGERYKHRERPRDRRPDDDIGGVCRVAHGEIGEPTLLSMQAILKYYSIGVREHLRGDAAHGRILLLRAMSVAGTFETCRMTLRMSAI
jgi:hypothetical protein